MQVSTQGDDDQTKDSTTQFFSAPVNYYIDLRHRLITSATNYSWCCRMRRPPAAGAPLHASFAQPYAGAAVPRPSREMLLGLLLLVAALLLLLVVALLLLGDLDDAL